MVDVIVREVGMRDGLQNIATLMPTEAKQRWCAAEAAAGVSEIEVCSFVPPRLIPQFADAAEVVAAALRVPGLRVGALIPNLKGAERGIAAGVHKLNYALSVSEGHNRANVRRPVAESVADFRRIVELAKSQPPERRPRVSAGMATALGCSIEGRVAESAVRRLAEQLAEAGADEIVIADTVGYSDPAAVRRVFKAVRADLGPAMPLAAHFHDTRGTGLANALAALDTGVRQFDASLGGLGGCPDAPGASGNIVMEDLVYMLERMGLDTGVDLPRLLEVRRAVVASLPHEAFAGAIARAGLPKDFAPAARSPARAANA